MLEKDPCQPRDTTRSKGVEEAHPRMILRTYLDGLSREREARGPFEEVEVRLMKHEKSEDPKTPSIDCIEGSEKKHFYNPKNLNLRSCASIGIARKAA